VVSPDSLPGQAGNELTALLAPIAPEIFVHEYWAKKPLFVKGTKDKFAGLFSSETFSHVLTQPGPVPADFLRASFDQKTPDGFSAPPETAGELASSVFRATPDQAVPLFDAGAPCAYRRSRRACVRWCRISPLSSVS
jgi:hypothetical protein